MPTIAVHADCLTPRDRLARRLAALLAGLALLAGCHGDGADSGPPPVPATAPLAVDTPPPTYPLALACAGHGGEVVLVLSLDAEGVPADVRIENSSRRRGLDMAAVAAVRTWRFRPATSRGKPVPTRIRVPVRFTAPVMRPDLCFRFDEEQRRAR